MTVVVDASCIVAALIDSGPVGAWAARILESDDLAAPHLLPVEVASILSRSTRTGSITADAAALAHSDLAALPVVLFPYGPLASRIWELRDNVVPYDAWYIAVAEAIGAPLATLDQRLARAPGTRCEFETPIEHG